MCLILNELSNWSVTGQRISLLDKSLCELLLLLLLLFTLDNSLLFVGRESSLDRYRHGITSRPISLTRRNVCTLSSDGPAG